MCTFILSSLLLIAAIAIAFAPAKELKVTSSAFVNDGMIPSKYSCQGAEVSPPLHIEGIPSSAKSLALIAQDPDAPMKGGFTHWVMWNIETDGTIPEDFKGAQQGYNGARSAGYKGMCPPSGTHHYHFTVYALDTKLNLSNTTGKDALEQAMKGHIIATGRLTGLYKK